jgi:hypothetical protein
LVHLPLPFFVQRQTTQFGIAQSSVSAVGNRATSLLYVNGFGSVLSISQPLE